MERLKHWKQTNTVKTDRTDASRFLIKTLIKPYRAIDSNDFQPV